MLREWDRPGASAVLVEEEEAEEPGPAGPEQAAAEKSEQERQREVALALRQAEAAMHSAESRLEDIPNLPSARLKREVHAKRILTHCHTAQMHAGPGHAR